MKEADEEGAVGALGGIELEVRYENISTVK